MGTGRGIVAAVAQFLADRGANILHTDQHVDAVEGVFFQRVEFAIDELTLAPGEIYGHKTVVF